MQSLVLNLCNRKHPCVIPEIDIWRAATPLLKRYGDKALEESRTRVDYLAADGDHDCADTWRQDLRGGCSAPQHHTARTRPPIATHPKMVPGLLRCDKTRES